MDSHRTGWCADRVFDSPRDRSLSLKFTGEYAVRTPHLRSYHERLHQLGQRFEKVQFFWIPREQNARADWLTKQAIRRVLRQGGNGPPSPDGREPFPGGTPGP